MFISQNVVFRYYPDADELSVYCAKPFPGACGVTEHIPLSLSDGTAYPLGCLVERDAYGQILDITVSPASVLIHPHFWKDHTEVENRPPFSLTEEYIENDDKLIIHLVNDRPCTYERTELEDLHIERYANGLIAGFEIHHPSNIYSSTSEDEKRELRLAEKKHAMDFLKSFGIE